jgi:hypothetical protein
MRKFKPKSQVVESLKKSTVLEIIETPGKQSIRRQVPFVPVPIDTDPTSICTLPSKRENAGIDMRNLEAHLPLGYIVKKNGLIKQTFAVSLIDIHWTCIPH